MNLLEATVLGIDVWRLCLVAVLLLSYLFYLHHNARAEGTATPKVKIRAESNELVYTDAPTVRLSDTQRIDRLHRVVTLKSGEHADLNDLTFDRLPRLRLSLKGIENESGQDLAHIKLDMGGAVAACGDSVKEVSENSFLVPRATMDEQRCSILHYCGKPDAVSFLQIKVKLLSAADDTVVIDVLHVRGRWQA